MVKEKTENLAILKRGLCDVYAEGYRVSGRPLTFAEIQLAFNAGFNAGRQSVEIVKPRKATRK